jgi:ABC-2 type transport system ATP-binding protein
MTATVSLQRVNKYYGEVHAVQDLNLKIRQGEILGLIGHNGAGKTTTLKMILGLVPPTSGDIRVLQQDISRNPTRVKHNIGYLPEESPLYDNMSVSEYLMFFSKLYKMPERRARVRIEELLNSLQLEVRDRRTGTLSKGMRRKVAIARALLHDPQLLVLDEPNSGLDPITSFFVINYLKQLKTSGKTILLSAHNLFHIEFICDRVAILRDGKLIVSNTMDKIRRKLGKREYQVHFRAYETLDYPRQEGNYVYTTPKISEIASMLETISQRGWTLVNLSVKESALEDIYIKLMTG